MKKLVMTTTQILGFVQNDTEHLRMQSGRSLPGYFGDTLNGAEVAL
jgi:hypothetical protein